MFVFFFFKQKTAYEMRISDWSSDVCSSDLVAVLCEDRHRDLVVPGDHEHPHHERQRRDRGEDEREHDDAPAPFLEEEPGIFDRKDLLGCGPEAGRSLGNGKGGRLHQNERSGTVMMSPGATGKLVDRSPPLMILSRRTVTLVVPPSRSEDHTYELQSLMRTPSA